MSILETHPKPSQKPIPHGILTPKSTLHPSIPDKIPFHFPVILSNTFIIKHLISDFVLCIAPRTSPRHPTTPPRTTPTHPKHPKPSDPYRPNPNIQNPPDPTQTSKTLRPTPNHPKPSDPPRPTPTHTDPSQTPQTLPNPSHGIHQPFPTLNSPSLFPVHFPVSSFAGVCAF